MPKLTKVYQVLRRRWHQCRDWSESKVFNTYEAALKEFHNIKKWETLYAKQVEWLDPQENLTEGYCKYDRDDYSGTNTEQDLYWCIYEKENSRNNATELFLHVLTHK